MKSYTQEELEEKFKQLSPAIEEVIYGVSAEKTLEEIGKKHKLPIDRLGILANETHLVMLGLTHPKDFINNLAERLELDKEIVKSMAQEINQRIFHKIREELKKMHGLEPMNSKPPAKRESTVNWKIRDLRKEKLAAKAAIIEPSVKIEPPTAVSATTEPAPVEPEKPKISTTPFEYKLKTEETIRAPLEEIKIPTEQKPPDKKYPTGDPYREPIE